jgi:hypothetical protein
MEAMDKVAPLAAGIAATGLAATSFIAPSVSAAQSNCVQASETLCSASPPEPLHIEADAPAWQSRARPTADVPTHGGYFHPNYFANGYFARGYWATPG